MARIVILLTVLAACSVLWIRHRDYNPLEPVAEGRSLRIRTDDFEARFFRGSPFSGGAMLFGGLGDEAPNAFWNAHMAWIDLAEARWLMQEYPDFHRCSSPGADHAKRMIQDHALIAANGRVRATLQDAVLQHEAAVRSGGDRICLQFAGEDLELEDAKLQMTGQSLDTRIMKAFEKTRFRFVTDARIVDCVAGR